MSRAGHSHVAWEIGLVRGEGVDMRQNVTSVKSGPSRRKTGAFLTVVRPSAQQTWRCASMRERGENQGETERPFGICTVGTRSVEWHSPRVLA